MPETNVGDLEVPRLPFEGDETSQRAAEDSLADLLTDDGDIAEVGTQESDESESDEAEDAADDEQPEDDDEEADEADESEDDAGEESEEDEDTSDEEDRESEEDDPESPEKQGLRLADYTRKTQALAEQRKQLESERATLSQQREEYSGLLEQAKRFLENAGPKPRTAAEWDTLRQQDPTKFATEWADWQRHQEDLKAVSAEQERVNQERLEEQREQINALLAAERQKLYEAIPEWQDDEVAAEEKAALKQYAATYGWTEEDLAQVVDHRLMVVLRKAQLYDAMTTKGKETIEQKRTTAKVLKPGGKSPKPKSNNKQLRARKEKLARTGRTEDAAAVILGMIDD